MIAGLCMRFRQAFVGWGCVATSGALLASGTVLAHRPACAMNIKQAWDGLMAATIPKMEPDPALVVAQPGFRRNSVDAFRNSFFFHGHSEFIHSRTTYTGLPTVTDVIDAPIRELADPDGVPFPQAFQPSSSRVYSFMNFGTRGFGSERINTSFSFRYRQDITRVSSGSPLLTILNTFGGNRRLELTSGYIDVNGLDLPGGKPGMSLRFGRQSVYGAELAAIDGISASMAMGPVSLALFGGRRFTYFSSPEQRAIGGGSLLLRLPGSSAIEYQSFFYIQGSHVVTFRKRLARSWSWRTRFKAIGGQPVDLGDRLTFLPPDGKTSLRIEYFRKLSDHDFLFDHSINAEDNDFFNRRARLRLGPVQPYGQVTLAARREIIRQLSLGSAVVIRRLTDAVEDAGPFATSFWDWRGNSRVYPWRHVEVIVEGHLRSADRQSPSTIAGISDVTRSGETRLLDLSFEVRRSLLGDRCLATVGGFYRRLDLQNRFVTVDRARAIGIIAGAAVEVAPRTELSFQYSLDDDFFLFRPSIEDSQVLRLGVRWRY